MKFVHAHAFCPRCKTESIYAADSQHDPEPWQTPTNDYALTTCFCGGEREVLELSSVARRRLELVRAGEAQS